MKIELLDKWIHLMEPLGTRIEIRDFFGRTLRCGDFVYIPPGRTGYSYAGQGIVIGQTAQSARVIVINSQNEVSHINSNRVQSVVKIEDPTLAERPVCVYVRERIKELK